MWANSRPEHLKQCMKSHLVSASDQRRRHREILTGDSLLNR
jgi:hypothetical protein